MWRYPAIKKGHAMKFPRRKFLHLAAGAAALPTVSHIARAQAYPARPVRIIVAASAGGATDITARLIGQWLSERLGQSFLVENRPGANSTIGTGAVVRAAADGYTLLMAISVDAINASLYQRLSYDFSRDIMPVARVAYTPLVLVVDPSLPVRSVPEFIAYAKANPGKLNLGSAGLGTPVNVTGELFKMKTGINVGQVQYRGSAPALADLLGGQVQAMFPVIAEAIEYIRAGRLRALAVTSTARSDVLPDIPIMADYVSGVEAGFWAGVVAPKNTPVEIIGRLNKEINAGLADAVMKARFADLGATVFPGTPAEFGKFIADETEKWAKVVKFANIKAD
jgi:tripartite-type tricarboxylate transporter receptor subunit TctC